jgi:hypothetical protein
VHRDIKTSECLKRETFPFPWLVCWCSSAVINVCTACASCWSLESHYKIPIAIRWLQSVCWRPSSSLKPNLVPSSSLLKLKIVTSHCDYISFMKMVDSIYKHYSAICVPPNMYLTYTMLGELVNFHPLEIIIDYRVRAPPSLLFNGYRHYFPALKRPERDVDHSSPSNVDVKDEWSCTSTRPHAFMTCTGSGCFTEFFNCCKIRDEHFGVTCSHFNTLLIRSVI